MARLQLSRKEFYYFLFESVLIIMSVFLALVLNENRRKANIREQLQASLNIVMNEMDQNEKILVGWLDYHTKVYANLGELRSNDSLRTRFLTEDGLYIYDVMPMGIAQQVLSRNAWEAFKNTESFGSLDCQQIVHLSDVYEVQKVGVEATVMKITNLLYDRASLKKENLDETIVLFEQLYHELISQEDYLIRKYASCPVTAL